ncbi:MAG: thioredoxin [Cycloclasticus sp. symbiont of Poecilosclerida sp. M]|nr:MAG: thioredoxin [Cycloclasticus sp. symbiont of Poecilosclerida sp. M]
MSSVIYYVHDPMCSWCWAFRKTWQEVLQNLPEEFEVRNLLGGLAVDSNEPMPLELQQTISATWHRIQKHVPGTQFNHDFWAQCQPRRSTYPPCRAVIAAREQDKAAEDAMVLAIQQAYYLQAKNPSDDAVLIACAKNIGLDVRVFEKNLNSVSIDTQLHADIKFARSIGANSFPSVILERVGTFSKLDFDYNKSETLLKRLV